MSYFVGAVDVNKIVNVRLTKNGLTYLRNNDSIYSDIIETLLVEDDLNIYTISIPLIRLMQFYAAYIAIYQTEMPFEDELIAEGIYKPLIKILPQGAFNLKVLLEAKFLKMSIYYAPESLTPVKLKHGVELDNVIKVLQDSSEEEQIKIIDAINEFPRNLGFLKERSKNSGGVYETKS